MGLREFLARPLFSASATVVQPNDVRVEGAGRSVSEEAVAPRSLDEFTGQDEAVRLLRVEVESAKRIGRPLNHFLLYGPPGVGKTTMAHVLAAETGALTYESSGAEFPTQRDLLLAFALVGKRHESTGRPVVWIIDEIDALPRVTTYALHSLLSAGHVTWQGVKYGRVPLTVAGTTNHMALVHAALRDRFQIVAKLDFYATDELARIAESAARRLGIRLHSRAAEFVGLNGAGSPRQVVRRILPALQNLLGDRHFASLEDAQQAVELAGLRPGGMSKSQVEYLGFLADAEAASVGTLSAFLGEPRRDVEAEVEPYLIRSKAVTITARGRQITQTGREYLSRVEEADRP